MQVKDLKNIKIVFERPKSSEAKGCEFLINPPRIQGGGLYDQVVTTEEELTFEDFMEFIFETGETIFTSSSIEEALVSMTSAVVSLAVNATSVSFFPDEYKEILDFIKETEEGYVLNSSKIEELVEKDSGTTIILEKLIEKKLLRKNSSGEYVVRKKILTNVQISIIKIADMEG